MRTSPTNYDDIIDSRDIIARIEELSAPMENRDVWAGTEELAELESLESLASEASGYAADWEYGEALIRDSYFTEYALELADDIGAVDHSAGWPMSCIDWERAARELQQDYTAVNFNGVTYWVR